MNNPSFTAKYLNDISFTEEAQHHLKVIDQNFWDDFSTQGRGYFSLSDQELIQQQACAKAKELLIQSTAPVNGEKLREVWTSVVTDFHRNNFWGFHPQTNKPKKPITEDQKIFRELRSYIGTLILGLLFLKTTFFYFGMRFSNNPSDENKTIFFTTIALWLIFLLLFAWYKHRRKNR